MPKLEAIFSFVCISKGVKYVELACGESIAVSVCVSDDNAKGMLAGEEPCLVNIVEISKFKGGIVKNYSVRRQAFVKIIGV